MVVISRLKLNSVNDAYAKGLSENKFIGVRICCKRNLLFAVILFLLAAAPQSRKQMASSFTKMLRVAIGASVNC